MGASGGNIFPSKFQKRNAITCRWPFLQTGNERQEMIETWWKWVGAGGLPDSSQKIFNLFEFSAQREELKVNSA